jgi:hypothetical protein
MNQNTTISTIVTGMNRNIIICTNFKNLQNGDLHASNQSRKTAIGIDHRNFNRNNGNLRESQQWRSALIVADQLSPTIAI